MEFKDIVKNRRAIRQYEAKPVPEETIRELLEIFERHRKIPVHAPLPAP